MEQGPNFEFAPVPDKVLVKFNVNPKKCERLSAFGVPIKPVNFDRKNAAHEAQAQEHGRAAFRYREVADSGVPVFGKDGAQNVSLAHVWGELPGKGYAITDIHMLPKSQGKMMTLVITLEDGAEEPLECSAKLMQELKNLLACAWQYVHVWANPPNEDGKVIHTVNASHRLDTPPAYLLDFADGLWGNMKV
jgi:hypothetical protein